MKSTSGVSNIHGYPVIRRSAQGTNVKVFTWLWEEITGPAHIEPVTVAVNTQRGLSAKLTLEAVADIRRLLVSESQRSVARRYGIAQSQVSRIARGECWAVAA